MLNGIVDSQKVRAQKVAASSHSTGGVASSLTARKTGSRWKGLRRVRQRDEEMQQRDEVQRQRDEAMRQ
jgi:hypothetical protein